MFPNVAPPTDYPQLVLQEGRQAWLGGEKSTSWKNWIFFSPICKQSKNLFGAWNKMLKDRMSQTRLHQFFIYRPSWVNNKKKSEGPLDGPVFCCFFYSYPNEASTQIEIISPFFGLTLKTYDITDNLDVLHGLKASDNIFIVTSLFMDVFLLLYWNPQKRW